MVDYRVIYRIGHKEIDLFFVISKQKNTIASKYFGYKQSFFYLDSISFLSNYHKQLCDPDLQGSKNLEGLYIRAIFYLLSRITRFYKK